MKTLDAALLTRARSPSQRPALLVAVAEWGGATLRWTDSDADVTFGGAVYESRRLEVSTAEQGGEGDAQSCTLTLDNADLALTDLVGTADPKGALLTVRRVFLDDLTVSQILYSSLVVRDWRLTQQTCVFVAEGLSALLRRRVPARLFSRNCTWEFKGTECTYAGAAETCDYTRQRCKELSNLMNFGGYRFVLPRGRS